MIGDDGSLQIIDSIGMVLWNAYKVTPKKNTGTIPQNPSSTTTQSSSSTTSQNPSGTTSQNSTSVTPQDSSNITSQEQNGSSSPQNNSISTSGIFSSLNIARGVILLVIIVSCCCMKKCLDRQNTARAVQNNLGLKPARYRYKNEGLNDIDSSVDYSQF